MRSNGATGLSAIGVSRFAAIGANSCIAGCFTNSSKDRRVWRMESGIGTTWLLHLNLPAKARGAKTRTKYRKDAAVLEKALQTEKDKFLRSRYTFYLARSYRDAGEKEKALE